MALLSVKEAAEILNVSAATVYALIQAGEIHAHRIGVGRGVIRVSREAIEKYLAATQVEGRVSRERLPRPHLKHLKL